MLFGYMTLFTALILSLSAAVYSILGLTAIFAAAFWPIVVLGGSLEIGKIVTTLWLHKYWKKAELQYKLYLCSAVVILMVLTSMGVFGFLSKAHLDQAVPSGDIQAQVQIFDDKIQTQKDNIKTARSALTQMDTAVDQVMGRSQDEKGADKAVAIRRSQARERTALQNDISKAQTEITRLQEQRAPIASQARQVEAEVGPIKYIAALIYGDNPDANILERAVRWVIILIVIVFDPLALTLLLAATKTFEWEHAVDLFNKKKQQEDLEFEGVRIDGGEWIKTGPDIPAANHIKNTTESDNLEPVFDRQLDIPAYEQDDGPLTDQQVEQIRKIAEYELPTGKVITKESLFTDTVIDDDEDGISPAEKEAQRAWKEAHPEDTIKKHRQLHEAGLIDNPPWNHPDYHTDYQDQLGLVADNSPTGLQGEVKGFGTSFPLTANKSDMFLRVDQLPSVLYKFNGTNWIEIDKELSDQHAYDLAYIDHLIEKISTGEYDPELLSNAERDSIEQRLKNKLPGE